jgi:hypothetical protein
VQEAAPAPYPPSPVEAAQPEAEVQSRWPDAAKELLGQFDSILGYVGWIEDASGIGRTVCGRMFDDEIPQLFFQPIYSYFPEANYEGPAIVDRYFNLVPLGSFTMENHFGAFVAYDFEIFELFEGSEPMIFVHFHGITHREFQGRMNWTYIYAYSDGGYYLLEQYLGHLVGIYHDDAGNVIVANRYETHFDVIHTYFHMTFDTHLRREEIDRPASLTPIQPMASEREEILQAIQSGFAQDYQAAVNAEPPHVTAEPPTVTPPAATGGNALLGRWELHMPATWYRHPRDYALTFFEDGTGLSLERGIESPIRWRVDGDRLIREGYDVHRHWGFTYRPFTPDNWLRNQGITHDRVDVFVMGEPGLPYYNDRVQWFRVGEQIGNDPVGRWATNLAWLAQNDPSFEIFADGTGEHIIHGAFTWHREDNYFTKTYPVHIVMSFEINGNNLTVSRDGISQTLSRAQ